MRRFLLGLALVAITATAANATTWVWWELEGSNCGATATTQGRLHTLVIEKPTIPEPPIPYYEFNLVMKMSNDSTGATQGLTGYGTGLWVRPQDVGIKTFAAPFDPNNPSGIPYFGDEATTGLLNPLNWSGTKSGNVNQGQQILDNYGRKNAGTAQPGLNATNCGGLDVGKAFIRFTLRINVTTEPYSELEYLYQAVDDAAFGHRPVTPAQLVVFGPNTGVAANIAVNDWATVGGYQPVIQIHAVPEPATLALFGLGLLGLIRRR